MILACGNLTPLKQQLKELRVNADGSFVIPSSHEFAAYFPIFRGFEQANNPLLLKLKNCEPHDDPWVGKGEEPNVRRSIFWLMDNSNYCFFGCGEKHIKMHSGDFVVFDDSVVHWVMAEKQWRGASVQLQLIEE